MKKLRTSIMLIALFLIGLNLSAQGQSNCKPTQDTHVAAPTNEAKPITTTCTPDKTSQQNPDYSIQINGTENTVNITSDATEAEATETQTTLPTDKNIVEINGEGNTVSINPKTTGQIAVKQNGKNNRVTISQKTSNP